MSVFLAIIFVFSGAAGLMYESIWSRYLGLFVGHSAYAQVIVLVIFLGGMSVGAAVTSRRSRRVANPLLAYAIVEAIVGALGLVFHDAYGVVTAFAYNTVFPALAGGSLLVVGKWLMAALLILPQSVLLGATFPLMSAGLVRLLSRDGVSNSGRALSLLYFANSLGAAVGVLVAGFYLIGLVGLPGTVLTAAIINVLCAVAAWLVSRTVDMPLETDSTAPATSVASATYPALRRVLLGVAFGTAVASFLYEIAWVRMLSLVLGSATHSFELMLSAFILGLALGALWLRARADRLRDPMRTLAIVQWVMGALAIATIALYMSTFLWTAWLIRALGVNAQGYEAFTVARYALCLAVMLPATFCAGMTLPLITRMLMSAGGGERSIGEVYAVNTLGSILGAGTAALFIMPALGLRNVLIFGGMLDIGLALMLANWVVRREPSARRFAGAMVAATAVLLVSVTLGNRFDQGILTSGVFRYGHIPERGATNMPFYADGRTATVSVRETHSSDGRRDYALVTNGKPDASLSQVWFDSIPKGVSSRRIEDDESTQLLLPMISLAHAPMAKRAAVIGQGSGMSSHLLLGSPYLDSLVTIEIEPEMINASHTFFQANHRVFDDPRSRFVYDDAKSFFAASKIRYDLILSEPSNPWVSGVSGLFTDEFYARVRNYLTPTGVFGQWLHLYEIDDRLVMSVIAAVHKNFPAYRIYLTLDLDMIIVASNQKTLPAPDWSVFGYPMIAEEVRRFYPLDRQTLDATLLVTSETLAPLVGSGRGANSDFYPILDFSAEQTRYLRTTAIGLYEVSGDRLDVVAALEGRRVARRSETSSALDLLRLRGLVTGARLRAGMAVSNDSTTPDRAYRQALTRLRTFDAVLAFPSAPPDWNGWMKQAMDVEHDLHGGTVGDADSAYFGRLIAYMHQHGAPNDARAAVRFMRAIAFLDWPAAAAESSVLIESRLAGQSWLNDDLLRDGVTIARLRTNDRQGAIKAYLGLAKYSTRTPNDFRVQLLAAHLRDGAPKSM